MEDDLRSLFCVYAYFVYSLSRSTGACFTRGFLAADWPGLSVVRMVHLVGATGTCATDVEYLK